MNTTTLRSKKFIAPVTPWTDAMIATAKAQHTHLRRNSDAEGMRALRGEFTASLNVEILSKINDTMLGELLTAVIYRGVNTTLIEHITDQLFDLHVKNEAKKSEFVITEHYFQMLGISQAEFLSTVRGSQEDLPQLMSLRAYRADRGISLIFNLVL